MMVSHIHRSGSLGPVLATRVCPKQDGEWMCQGSAMLNALSESPHMGMNGREQAVLSEWKAPSLLRRPCEHTKPGSWQHLLV